MTHYLHILSGTMVNVYRKCENESIFWVLLTPMRLFLWKHSFIFHPLWTFHSRSSSKVNRANSPLPCIFHFALSTFALSRGSWTRILRSVRKSNKTECQDLFHVESIRQGSKIDRDLRLSYQRKVIRRVYIPLRRATFIPLYVTSGLNLVLLQCEYFSDINLK